MPSIQRTGGFAGDIWGGVAAMLVALPSSIAFGVLVYSAIGREYAGAGALAGILGAAVLGIVAPLVSRNGGFITAPCAPAAAVLSALAAQLAAGGDISPQRVIALLGLTVLVAALLQAVFGAVRAGRLIKFIPYQVVSGYLSGVALAIALAQLPRLLGLPREVMLAKGWFAPHLWDGRAVAIGLVTIAAMALAPRLTQRIPGAIVGLAAGVAAYFGIAVFAPGLLTLEGNSLVIGPILIEGSVIEAMEARASSLLEVRAADLSVVAISAATLAVLLSIDTLKTGVVLDALMRRRHDSNRELLGQGAANAAAFLVGGMAGSATMGATLVNFTSGGRTPRSGIIEGALVLVVYALFVGLVAWVPTAALAGLLLMVAWRMFDRSMFRLVRTPATRVDFAVIVTVVAVAQVGLIIASAVGVGLAILLFIRDQIRGSVIVNKMDLRAVRSKRRRLTEESQLIQTHGHEAEVVQLHGNLFFGTTDQLFSEIEADLARVRYLLVDLRRVQSMDYTAAHLLEQMRQRLTERGGELIFSGMPSSLPTHADIEHYLSELGFLSERGIRVFDTRDSALEWMEDRLLEAAGWEPRDEGPSLELAGIEIFAGLDSAALARIESAMTIVPVPAGGRIFGRGDEGDEVYFVRRGRMHALLPLESGKRHHLATFCRGDFFGEMVFLDRGRRSADLEAATDTELFVLSRRRFDELAREDPALAARLFESLALALSNRLRSADAELRALEER